MAKKKRKPPLKFWLILIFILILAYALVSHSSVKTRMEPGGICEVKINFFLSMRQEEIASRTTISPEIPGTKVNCKIRWLNPSTVVLRLEQEGYPRGQLLTLRIAQIPAQLPFLKKNVRIKIRPRTSLSVMPDTSLEKVPACGPIPVNFNSPVNPKTIRKAVTIPAPGELKPRRIKSGRYIVEDLSRWLYYPEKPLENNKTYSFVINPGLSNMSGSTISRRQVITFVTAVSPGVVSSFPKKDAENVQLFCDVEFILDQDISGAEIKLINAKTQKQVPGKTMVRNKKLIFRPSSVFMPEEEYKAVLRAVSKENGILDDYEISFSTISMGDNFWVDVDLGERHTLTVYRGKKKIRKMPASGGMPETPTPTGFFYIQDRGRKFWSYRFGEGATYWVRLVGQVLIHSVPRDSQWRIKKEEHAKLGLPASHGCVRLEEDNAKWFYENIPRGTLVIIHK